MATTPTKPKPKPRPYHRMHRLGYISTVAVVASWAFLVVYFLARSTTCWGETVAHPSLGTLLCDYGWLFALGSVVIGFLLNIAMVITHRQTKEFDANLRNELAEANASVRRALSASAIAGVRNDRIDQISQDLLDGRSHHANQHLAGVTVAMGTLLLAWLLIAFRMS